MRGSRFLSCVVAVALALGVGSACNSGVSPSLRVLGVQETARSEVVFVQVTNPASQPMRLTKLEYVFASQGNTLSTGEVPLSRDVPANSTVVVEVPLNVPSDSSVTMKGRLTAVIDEIVKSFSVSAQLSNT